MKSIRTISRFVVGVVFIFSGFVKGIDPWGSAFKFQDYFAAFGLDFLDPLALPLGIVLSTFEFVLGAVLIFNIRMRMTSWVLLIFMGFFTLLTFYLALDNPVHDCGCFGDALVMTNWETFYKNLVLMVFVAIIFLYRKRFQSVFGKVQQAGLIASTTLIILAFTFYSYHHLPFMDFRPYHIGTHIPEKMKIPEDAPQPEYKTILKYKKDGQVKEFTMDSLPDSTWQWVETKNIQVSQGYTPPIEGFSITTLDGNDITDIVLNETDYTFLLIAYDLKKASRSDIEDIKRLSSFCRINNRCNFIALTASVEQEIKQFREQTHVRFPFYHADEITLKTIVRSNPGLMLLKKGTILDKWHHNDIPSPEQVQSDYLEGESPAKKQQEDNSEKQRQPGSSEKEIPS